MADPLTLLRQFNINKKEIIECDNQIIFGEFAWNKNVKTNYLMWGSAKEGSTKEYYTLECLLFLLKNVTLTHPVYVRQAAAENIPVVRRPDRKDILAFLNGETATSAGIDRAAPLEMPCSQPKRAAGDSLQSACKRPRLDSGGVGPGGDAQAIRCLSDAMPVEQIAAIKAKWLAKKRAGSGPGVVQEEEERDLRRLLDREDDRCVDIEARERHGCTRHTVLQSSGKNFAKDVLAILQFVKAREEGWSRPPKPLTPRATPLRVGGIPIGYNRYDQQRFIRHKEEVEGFRIDTMGTYHGMTLKSVTEGQQKQKQRQHLPVGPLLPGPAEVGGSPLPVKRVSRTPIIIIPAAPTSLITMYNAKEVLQDLRFVSTEEKKLAGHRRDNEVLLQRQRSGGLTVPYRVIDNPLKLSCEDWERVVATFVMGPAWQFKGWPWGGRPVDIFSNVCAFHLKYDEMHLDNNVGRWAVHVIELSRCRRHLDRAALMVFWELLDRYMMKNKPHLRF